MRSGFVTHIFVARMSGAPMVEVDEVQAVAGRGIVGDRYFDGTSALPDTLVRSAM